ncbi:MAG: SCP2 sterol-binding domain-containing protein [Pseudobutyrivibrio sp.]|nr:SCP2 sterol-binding domain-containing protein [Pseudobutyrivibrio sp.]
MKVNIYYGGRGLLEDPTLYVINKMQQVLVELQVEVHLYNIYEQKNAISLLPQTLKDADGIILATTVEWLGIGGYMNQFLDACWLYADKTAISSTYMQPVVMSTTYGEREAMVTLENAWEILGGIPCSGICGYVEDMVKFKANTEYGRIIEKKVETLYRTISQHTKGLPTSNQAITRSVQKPQQIQLSPDESELQAKFVSNDNYVQTSKADIADLSSMFKELLGKTTDNDGTEYIMELRSHFRGAKDFSARYLFMIDGKKQPLFVSATNSEIECHYGREDNIDVYMKLTREVMDHIVAGRETFQRAFSVGEMTAKGNFRTLRMLDEIFKFS